MFDLVNALPKEAWLGVSVKESRPVVDRISEVVSPILWALGLELVDVVCVGQGARTVVRVYIDKSGGVTVEDCGRAHLAISPALDVADPFPHAYTLEVSSPGLDRAFRRIQDYRRAVGKQVSVKLRQPIDGQWRVAGLLTEVREQGVTLVVSEPRPERTVILDFDSIAEARRVVTF
ncbi:MAG: Ribosome maturation factor RimP [Nitrospirota bacterium]